MLDKPTNVEAYIGQFPPEVQQRLEQIRKAVIKIAPQAQERISYGMPGYYLNGQLVFFAAFEKHIGFYALPEGNEAFRSEISQYKTGKGSIQFPMGEKLPLELIKKIVTFRVAENLAKKTSNKTK